MRHRAPEHNPAARGCLPVVKRQPPRIRRLPTPTDLPSGDLTVAQRTAILVALGPVAGNRAMAGVVRPESSVTVQRWSSSEHVRLGNVIDRPIPIGGGVSLTYGQIVALAGDEFGSLEELMEATRSDDGRAMIRAHLERAKIPGTAAALLPVPSETQVTEAKSQYVTLAMNNTPHFVAGGTAVESWLEKHTQAIDLAVQSGLSHDDGLLDEAYLTEAFGDHFLTDAFSSGHIRVPRQEIENYYVHEFAPTVFDRLLETLRERAVDEIYDQVEQQTSLNELAYVGGLAGGLGARAEFRRRIRAAVNERIAGGFAAIGGRGQAAAKFGQALAGVVSGAMHDAENRDGLKVVSGMDQTPWTAYGDSDLDKNPQHRAYVEEAVRTAVADLERARSIGLEESQEVYNVVPPDSVPGTVYFGFDKDTLTPTASTTVEIVAHFLNYHPSTEITLVGNADPIGEEPYNDDLGSRRAERVAQLLITNGVDAGRVKVDSLGERAPVSHDRADYHLNRRVMFVYASAASPVSQTPEEVGLGRARQRALTDIGPPYAAEEHFPRPAVGENADLPAWRWDELSASFQSEMSKWLTHYINEYAEEALANEALDDEPIPTPIGDFTVSPRPIARELIGEISSDPLGFLGRAMGRPAGGPQ